MCMYCHVTPSHSPFIDSSFVAVLYTSDSDKMMRYTDEGETAELCKWTVDLSSLPTFQQNAAMPQAGGFYTGRNPEGFRKAKLTFLLEFELGLELDSAEVRGILLFNNQEWGRFVGLRSVLIAADM
jgi:hypothetical protein